MSVYNFSTVYAPVGEVFTANAGKFGPAEGPGVAKLTATVANKFALSYGSVRLEFRQQVHKGQKGFRIDYTKAFLTDLPRVVEPARMAEILQTFFDGVAEFIELVGETGSAQSHSVNTEDAVAFDTPEQVFESPEKALVLTAVEAALAEGTVMPYALREDLMGLGYAYELITEVLTEKGLLEDLAEPQTEFEAPATKKGKAVKAKTDKAEKPKVLTPAQKLAERLAAYPEAKRTRINEVLEGPLNKPAKIEELVRLYCRAVDIAAWLGTDDTNVRTVRKKLAIGWSAELMAQPDSYAVPTPAGTPEGESN